VATLKYVFEFWTLEHKRDLPPSLSLLRMVGLVSILSFSSGDQREQEGNKDISS
jgi:hypothetical protein